MNGTDKAEFAEHILAVAEIYGRALSPAALDVYWSALTRFSIADVRSAMNRHVNDPEAGQYFPKPADLIRAMGAGVTSGGYPGPDEAWGMLLRVIRNERDTGVLTEEMRAGWAACSPILDEGDEVGARKCFLEAYARHVEAARQAGRPARWTVTLGTCHELREQRLHEAVQAGRIAREHATHLLPGPPLSINRAAALLEHQGGERGPDMAARLRQLVDDIRANMRRSQADAEERRERERLEFEEGRRRALEAASARSGAGGGS